MTEHLKDFLGLWKRRLNYEPRDSLADSDQRDGSIVMWLQTPTAYFCDFRRIKSEGTTRSFAGLLQLTSRSNDQSFELVWHRHIDTKPEACPTGVDKAICRFVGTPGTRGCVLFEEGDGYLEVWELIEPWTPECFVEVSMRQGTEMKDISVTIGPYLGVVKLAEGSIEYTLSGPGGVVLVA